MSRRKGSSLLALGAANASGLVPSRGLEPRVGTTVLVGVVEVLLVDRYRLFVFVTIKNNFDGGAFGCSFRADGRITDFDIQ